MRRVFLGLFCLSFVSSMFWTHHSHSESKPRNFSIKDLGFSFQKIKAGSFTMGSPKDEKGRNTDEAQVEVTITKAFEMQRTELTQKQYFLVTGEKPSFFSGPEYCKNYDQVNEICPDHPVERVSWDDAKEFIRKLNASAGVEGCERTPKPPGCYRLPTEAEYEWAVRGETKTAYFFGNDWSQLGDYAVYGDNSRDSRSLRRQTHEVTFGKPNPNNLNGIIGNVWEWTEDVYKVKLEGGRDPLNTKKSRHYRRVVRGGGWFSNAKVLRSAYRGRNTPITGTYDVGFRLVRMSVFLMSKKSATKVQQCRVLPREDAVTPLSLFTPLRFL